MLNPSKSSEEGQTFLKNNEIDLIFEKYLKPLKSKNARLIFKIFAEQGPERSVTTLDIETKLLEHELKLDKKEINGWLVSLLNAGLISKNLRRGKPTVIRYDGKYTFDLWTITELGIKVNEWIQNFIDKTFLLKNDDGVYAFLNHLITLDKAKKDIEVQMIKEKYIIIKCLEALSTNKNMTNIDLKEMVNFNFYDVDKILLKYSNNESVQQNLFNIAPQKGLINRFKKLLGFSNLYSCKLSKYGEPIANKLKM